MATRVKLTVSVDGGLARELRETSRRRRQPRSHLVEEALKLWQKRNVEAALKEGYQAMRSEDRQSAEDALPAIWDVVK